MGILEKGDSFGFSGCFFFFLNLFFALAKEETEKRGLSHFGETVKLWLGHLLLF